LVDIKARKIKNKFFDSTVFGQIIDKELQRSQQETYHLYKATTLKIEDKSLIKTL
jgi:hypothetical protein